MHHQISYLISDNAQHINTVKYFQCSDRVEMRFIRTSPFTIYKSRHALYSRSCHVVCTVKRLDEQKHHTSAATTDTSIFDCTLVLFLLSFERTKARRM